MALSMDEQRMLAEIERRLAAEDPGLATRLSSFRRPGPAAGFRTTRGRIIGSICTVILLAVIGFTVYAMVPFRSSTSKTPLTRQTSASPAVSAAARTGQASVIAPVGNASPGGVQRLSQDAAATNAG